MRNDNGKETGMHFKHFQRSSHVRRLFQNAQRQKAFFVHRKKKHRKRRKSTRKSMSTLRCVACDENQTEILLVTPFVLVVHFPFPFVSTNNTRLSYFHAFSALSLYRKFTPLIIVFLWTAFLLILLLLLFAIFCTLFSFPVRFFFFLFCVFVIVIVVRCLHLFLLNFFKWHFATRQRE